MQDLVRALAVLCTGAAGAFWLLTGVFVAYDGYVEDASLPPSDFSGEIVASAAIAGVLTVLAGACWWHAARLRRR